MAVNGTDEYNFSSTILGMNSNIIENIGNTGTDFIASTGALTLAGVLTANGGITMADATNIALNTTTGTKIGTATSQKLAFYNSAPIIQPSGNALTALSNLGLVASPTLTSSDVGLGNVTNNAQLITGNSTQLGYFNDIYLDDADASNHLILNYGSDVASDFTLGLIMIASRNLTIAGDASISGTNTGDQFTSVTASRLLGRGDSGAGAAQEITLGTNLSMSGTTLNATGGGSTNWDTIGNPGGNGDIAMGQTAQTLDWNMASDAALDGLTITFTHDVSDSTTQRAFVVANANDGGSNGTLETIQQIDNRDANETVTNGLLIENTGAGTLTNALNILETAGTVTTAINIGNNVGTGITIGTGVTTGISVGSGGITIAAGALAVNSDSITSDGTLVINASGTVDVDDILNANSITSDAGVSIATGNSYTGAGIVTLSSGAASGLTINSGTTGTLAIGDDASAETINIGTGAADKDITLGSTTSGSTVKIQSGSASGITIEANNASTGSVQIGDGGAASGTPDLLVLDIGSAEPAGAIGSMYYSTALNKFRCYQNSGWTDCIGAGGGGSPGGADTDIQFNDGGVFGGESDFNWNKTNNTLALDGTDTEIDLMGVTNEPSAPPAGNLLLYSKNIGGRMMPKFVGPSGMDMPIQPLIAVNKIGYWNPPGNATTVPGVFGFTAPTAQGTATARNVASTNLFTRMRRLGYVSSATAGNLAGHYNPAAGTQYTIGNGSGLGGFFYIVRFGTSDAATVAGARQFVGLSSNTAAPTNVEPSTLTNSIGIGHGASDTNLKIFYGGSAAQTPIDLGANFPANTLSTDMYELILFAPTNVNNSVSYRVTRLNTGNTTSGTLTAATPGTQLPASTTFLGHRVWRTNNATALAVGIDVVSVYIETDY